jgi:hypothetical protein
MHYYAAGIRALILNPSLDFQGFAADDFDEGTMDGKEVIIMPNWSNYAMRKYGQGIRDNILSAYKQSFIRACVAKAYQEELDREWDKLFKSIPEDQFHEV